MRDADALELSVFLGVYFDGNDDRTKLSDELFSLVDWTAERKIVGKHDKRGAGAAHFQRNSADK